MEGYVKAPHNIMRDPSLSALAKVAWLLMAGMPDGYHPTRDQWMAMLRIKDKRAWFRTIRELDAAGLIEIEISGARRFYKARLIGEENAPITVRKTHLSRCAINTHRGDENAPYKNNIEEQNKNNSDARTRLREEVACDMMVEMGCRSCNITQEQYRRFAQEIFNDWEFTDLPDHEWTKNHFLSVMRIKSRESKRNGTNQRRPSAVTGQVPGATQGENPLAGYPAYNKTGS